MKNLIKYPIFLLLLGAVAITISCSDDEGSIIDLSDDGGLLVSNGFYPAKVGEDPIAIQRLTSSTVDAPENKTFDRDGFFQVYAFLTSGNYNLVEVDDGEVIATIGGTASTISGEDGTGEDAVERNMECDADDSSFTLVTISEEGNAFNIPNDGFYVMTYDVITNEIVYDEITSAAAIGAATPQGWSTDTELSISSVSAEGATWTADNINLEEGEWKFRFNCRWSIDRRIDATQSLDNENGYALFTNFGNSLSVLLPGNEGSNIVNETRGAYTITLSWDPSSGFSATATKTGELEPLPEYPEELWLIGGSIGGWDWDANGIQMIPVHSNAHLFWRIVWIDVDAADPGIKFAPQADWIGDFGSAEDALEEDGIYTLGTNNVPSPETSGYYMIVVNMDEDAETIEIAKPLVYGIGDAFGSFDDELTHLFTENIEDQILVSPNFIADGDLRMYTTASTFIPVGDGPAVEWWQAEFVVIDGVIEYRGTGGDQERLAVNTGSNIALDFINGTGTIQ